METAKIEAQIVCREIIKPSSPTPPHLRSHELSLLDQLAMRIYIPIMLFYTSTSPTSCLRLKKCLSETLTSYYPFAGRLADDGLTIHCGDQGIDFVEARVGCQLHEYFLQKNDFETQNLLFPPGFLWKNDHDESCSLLAVQLSFFDCGGAAICLSISHKIADGRTITTFIQDWAAITAAAAPPPPPLPIFISNSVVSLNLPATQSEILLDHKKNTCVTKRYVFDALQIAALRKSMHDDLDATYSKKFPTKVEIVTSLVFKCAINTSSQKKSLLIQLVNMRGRVSPPLPENSVGNFTWYYTVLSPAANNETNDNMINGMNELAVQLKNGKVQVCRENRNANDWLSEVLESTKEVKTLFDDLDVYRCSSFCKWPFYEMDFGWGKPKWAGMADSVVKNVFVLFDTPDGDGIEASVTLEEEDMMVFEKNKELLLAFAPSN